MPYGLKDIELEKMCGVFASNERIERVVLYGSRAKGNYKPFSDVDITLMGEKLTHSDLNRISLAVDDLLLPYQFDISIFHTLKNEALIDHIHRIGITIYERESEWKEYKLGDFIKIKHGYAFKGEYITSEETNNILVTPGNFHIGGGFKDDKFKYYSNDNIPSEYILKGGDIVVTMTDLSKDSDTLGYSAKIPLSNSHKYLHNQRIGLVQFINDAVCPDFVYWLMRTREYQSYIVGSASGTSIMHTSPSRIENYSCEFPPLDTQRRIAAILSSLDDKIDLLHRENATLEQMAETLFRQWFVVEAKEEWEEGKLGDILSVKGGTTPSTKEPSFWDGDIAWTSPRDVTTMDGLYLFETEKKITQKGLEQISSGLLPAGTLLMSSRAPVGVLAFAEIPLAINQGYIAILDDKGYSKEFIYLWLKTNMEMVHSYSNGSTFMEISKSAFKSLDISIPSKKEVDCFVQDVNPYFEKIRTNEIQIRTLTKTRDGLLPKLMSNEITIR